MYGSLPQWLITLGFLALTTLVMLLVVVFTGRREQV